MTITKTGRRVALVGLLAMIAAVLPLTAASAQTGPEYVDFNINADVEASDALQTSILLSQAAFPNGTDTVLLTTSEDGADALSSGVLANDAALLYYSNDEGVVDAHVEEITRLGATNVIVIGGTERIPDDVVTALEGMNLTVTRLSGPDRISTSNEVLGYAADNRDDFNATAKHISRAFGTEDNSQTAFADAVGLGAWDAQGGAGSVLAPSDASVLSEDYPTTQYFTDVNPDNERIVPIGGEAAVPMAVLDYLAGEPANQEVADRVAGENRAATAVAINGARGLDPADLAGVVVVDGFADDFFVDAYATSGFAGNNDYAVVLSNGEALSPESATYLANAGFAQNDGTTSVYCPPKTTDAACDEAITLTGGDPADKESRELEGDEEVMGNTGVIVDLGADSYTYQPAEGDAVEVEYDTDEDTFTVDGRPATAEFFENSLDLGDRITVTDNADGTQTHDLVNVDAADTGVIGNVNTAAGTFDIIEPVSGVVLSDDRIDYVGDCDLYDLNGGRVILAQFDAALNEGDTYDTSEDAAGNTTCSLTDATVSGSVNIGDTVVADTDFFQIGNLGDDFASTNNDTFVTSDAKFTAGDLVITVDGVAITDYADFSDVLSDGDLADYSRTNDIETVSLINTAPETISGQAVNGLDTVNDSFFLAADGEKISIEYGPDTVFVVNGFAALAINFETQYTAGDAISYTPADAAEDTDETITLTDQNLSGAVGDVDSGANTYEVLDASGDIVLQTVTYVPATEDLFVDGVQVDEADFDEAIDAIDDGDATGTVTVDTSGVRTAHRLVLTDA